MRRTAYDKQAVTLDIIQKILNPAEIAEKYGITINNVYLIKAGAVRAGLISSKGIKSIAEQIEEEKTVPYEIREKVKDLREKDMTTTEITTLLNKKGILVSWEEVSKVMNRSSDESSGRIRERHRLGKVIRG